MKGEIRLFGVIKNDDIKEIHDVFDELGYRIVSNFSHVGLFETAIKSLNHTETLEDAKNVIKLLQFCIDKYDRIEKIFISHLNIWNSFKWHGNKRISYVDDDEAAGSYYITNGINKNYKDIFISSIGFGNDAIRFVYNGGKFYIDAENDFYLKYSKLSSKKMKMYDLNGNHITNIIFDDMNFDIYLDKNSSPFEIISNDGVIEIYWRDYIYSLDDEDDIDREKMVAMLGWDVLKKKSNLGISKILLYDDVSDREIEILLLFAASTILLFRSLMSSTNSASLFLLNNSLRMNRKN